MNPLRRSLSPKSDQNVESGIQSRYPTLAIPVLVVKTLSGDDHWYCFREPFGFGFFSLRIATVAVLWFFPLVH